MWTVTVVKPSGAVVFRLKPKETAEAERDMNYIRRSESWLVVIDGPNVFVAVGRVLGYSAYLYIKTDGT